MKKHVLILSLFISILSLTGCTGFLFHPEDEMILTPGKLGVKYEDVYFESTDQTKLHGWWMPAEKTEKGTILFLHGNAENISTHFLNIYWLPSQQYNVFAFDYRGYGNSEGTPSIEGLTEDATAAINYLLTEKKKKNIFVLGQSLGGTVAINTLSSHPEQQEKIKSLIIDSAFSDLHTIVREKAAMFWLTWALQYPISWTFKNNDLREEIKNIHIPTLFIISEKDQIVPPHHMETLYIKANDPKEKWIIPGIDHTQALQLEDVQKRFVKFLNSTR